MWYRYGLKLREVSYEYRYTKEINGGGGYRHGFKFTMNGNSIPIEFIIKQDVSYNKYIESCGGYFNGFIIALELKTGTMNNPTSFMSKPIYILNREFIKLLFSFAHEFGHYMQHKNLNKQISSLLKGPMFEKQDSFFYKKLYNIQMSLKYPKDILNYKKDLLDIFIDDISYLLQIMACFRLELNANEFVYKFDRNLWDSIGYVYASKYHETIIERILWINDFILNNKEVFALALLSKKIPDIELPDVSYDKAAILPNKNDENFSLDSNISDISEGNISNISKNNENLFNSGRFVSIIDLFKNSKDWLFTYKSIASQIDQKDLSSAIVKIENIIRDANEYLRKVNIKFKKRRPRRGDIEDSKILESKFANVLKEMLETVNIRCEEFDKLSEESFSEEEK